VTVLHHALVTPVSGGVDSVYLCWSKAETEILMLRLDTLAFAHRLEGARFQEDLLYLVEWQLLK